MAKTLDFTKLYLLQDGILKRVNSFDNAFYLTGGTALHRFYYDARYSDDLDFFVSNGQNFHEDIDEIIQHLLQNNFTIKTIVNARDFYRTIINDTLQIDFVNDRVYRYKKSKIIDNIRVDNKLNILTNKINAINDRDEEKDIFDLFCFCYYEQFDWQDILSIASKKAFLEKDVLIYRLQTFPLPWLHNIKTIKQINISKDKIDTLCRDITHETANSLYHTP